MKSSWAQYFLVGTEENLKTVIIASSDGDSNLGPNLHEVGVLTTT